MDVRIRNENGEWVQPLEYQKEAYIKFTSETNVFSRNEMKKYTINTMDGIYECCIEKNNMYDIKIYIDENHKYPIVNYNDVKVFLTDVTSIGWYRARDYQIWSFYDFIYSDVEVKYYKSNDGGINDEIINYTVIPLALPMGIIFKISKNENGTIYYEKNDINRTRVRISNNEYERIGYQGYYNRITDSGNFTIDYSYVQNNDNNNVIIGKIDNMKLLMKEVDDDETMCLICNVYERNIRIKPCNHEYMCSICCKNMLKKTPNKKLCPFCRVNITDVCCIE